ncbi:hypothetical protein [Rhodococcus sp. T7]|uniref:hypothetical protein n=1 Tax=Rhodococcus sp. T7 TaxID=627444 RepID=UPI001358CDDB|nr:hypothetical protein [Rhodococcus sp. T7]KAF0957290.1 hypothetical protein MLGJGCBP_09120 [Rhodococcus sp. T7]KAF0965125.1 hypothetical protein MLGJGCBP_01725 [Rhodococcus sp. T7]
MKRALTVCLAAGLMTAACGSTDAAEQPPQTAQAPIESPKATTSKTPATTPAQSPILKKRIGEPAGQGCDPNGGVDDTCDVIFTITDIARGEQCAGHSSGTVNLPANSEVVRFDIDVTTAPTFKYPDADTMMLTQFWSVVGPDGYLSRDLDVAIGCDTEADAVYKSLEPNTKLRSSIPIVVPIGAKILRLSDNGRGWEWEIPT